MKLELEDSVRKRAWVAKAWDARFRKPCWEFVKRKDFNDPTFYLLDSGIYCVSGEDPATDRNRWLAVHKGQGEWCRYKDIAHLVSVGNANPYRALGSAKMIFYTFHVCYRCEETFTLPDGTEPYRDLVSWTEDYDPIYEPLCNDCAETREWEKARHSHKYNCGEEFWVEGPRGRACDICRGYYDLTLDKSKVDCGCAACAGLESSAVDC